MRGPKTLCGVWSEPEDSSPMLTWTVGYFWSLHRGVSPWLEVGPAQALSSRGVAAVSRFPSCGSRDMWLFLEAFPRGFPMRLSLKAFPRGCPTCHRGVCGSSASMSRQCREIRFLWNGLRYLGDSWNGGTTLEILSPFLWREPPLEMRRERREFFPEKAGK